MRRIACHYGSNFPMFVHWSCNIFAKAQFTGHARTHSKHTNTHTVNTQTRAHTLNSFLWISRVEIWCLGEWYMPYIRQKQLLNYIHLFACILYSNVLDQKQTNKQTKKQHPLCPLFTLWNKLSVSQGH